MFSKVSYLLRFTVILSMISLLTMIGCASFLERTIKDTAGPSSPSKYFISIDADPRELPYPAAETEITVKVWDSERKPVSGVPVYLYPKFPYAGFLHEDVVVTNGDGIAKTILKDTSAYGGSQYVEARLEDLRALVYILFMPDSGPGVQNP